MSCIPECELCGKSVNELTKIEVEGSIVNVCPNCVKFGKPVEVKMETASEPAIEDSMELASDYGTRIKKARESQRISRTEFANNINERESVIKRVENQTMIPDDELVKKIERFLKISLSED